MRLTCKQIRFTDKDRLFDRCNWFLIKRQFCLCHIFMFVDDTSFAMFESILYWKYVRDVTYFYTLIKTDCSTDVINVWLRDQIDLWLDQYRLLIRNKLYSIKTDCSTNVCIVFVPICFFWSRDNIDLWLHCQCFERVLLVCSFVLKMFMNDTLSTYMRFV